ncbi:UDP-glucose 4-epimerase [Candidatus Pelagibacter sp. IMCC9063]|uniref:GDP-mannose 4,6-dehydratase n=1 Tax=Pelagibacter sp. (strain IMCC9063) TaxID=1002672 RepID=UPI00020464E2|nr:GDP-mannose 4,6-dehydratase [Candidatus Pelagibacter sp. IMCC9063]AEA80596.1 UDP-glucose 4-epimerase [Candidatus Pelagibacter sp. IMCC9063]|tara:strand:- start:44034 stop:45026 length:993 start_codon:yes stop_codon:yes gene_type:complete
MNILVTGSEGFIGSHLVEKLLNVGHKVKALVLYNSFNSAGWLDHLKNNKNLKIIFGDIRDENFLLENFKNIDCVFHLAALISIPHSYVSFNSFLDTNIKGTTNILNASRKHKVKKIFVTSTSEVYGSAQYVPIDETHPLSPQSPYAATKVSADSIAISFFKSFDLPVTVLRPFNAYGPRQSARAIIPSIIAQVLNSKKFIKVGNIKSFRDFTYVDDTVNGFICALTAKNILGETINISTGYETSIKELIEIVKREIGKPHLKLIFDKKRFRPGNSEVNRLLGCNKKAKKLLKWKPSKAGLRGFQDGIRKTISWFKVEDNLKQYNSNTYNT